MRIGQAQMARLLAGVTVLATGVAGYHAAAPALVVPLAALALMADGVIATAVRLRRLSAEPLSSKTLTYLVMGALGWLIAAWTAYVAGALLRGL
ncbi:MAG: hypothetical protein NW223_14865 [Hyphomicrobiaceae bacterium]|nr:hypothetical protein [Hyphomicrobiaceae bacterium]